jgi:DNA polymerase-1
MSTSKPVVYLVDASGYIFRAYFAIKGNMSAADGTPTNAVYGFTQMLIKLIKDEKPSHLIPVFDVSRKSFRTEIYSEYKANRPDAPPDLIPQMALIREVVRAFNLPAVELQNYEADDLIGTLARQLVESGHSVRIVTSDKDLMQLVSDDVCLVDTWKNKVIRKEQVFERFGVEPERVIEVLGLAGDHSDNVPGVPGVGEKTAIGLIQEFGDIEGVLANIDKVSGKKRQENLRENAELARLSRKLVIIDTHAPIEANLDEFSVGQIDVDRARDLFTRLQFRSLLESLDLGISKPAEDVDRDKYICVNNLDMLNDMIRHLQKASYIAFDTETLGVDTMMEAPLVGMSFSSEAGKAWYVPVAHRVQSGQIPKKDALALLSPVFSDPTRNWVMQNAKFDVQIMLAEGITFAGRIDDTMLMSYVENPAKRQHGLDALAMEHLGHGMISYEQVAGKGKSQVTFDHVDLEHATRYAAEDADITLRLYEKLRPMLGDGDLWRLYDEMERPLVSVLAGMEQTGFKVDQKALEEMSGRFERMMVDMEQVIYNSAGGEFNINSPSQLAEILFERMKLPHGKKTKTGYSTDVGVLTKLAAHHELPQMILDYRQLAKLRSTYTDALLRLINPKTGRIHSSFNQTIALTGRLSSSDPNLQNIPVRTEAGRLIRQAFIAEDGCVLLSADYSQVELRILAHLSGDSILIDSFKKGEDIHTRTAAEVFDTMVMLVDREMRRRAKAVNFGIVYGQTAFGLAESLGISQKEAREIIENYFTRYAGVKTYIDKQHEQAHQDKQVFTMFGRRIPLSDIDSSNANIRGYAERVAINAPIQGSAADIIKRAMLTLNEELIARKLKTRLLLQVHDELVLEVPEPELDEVRALIEDRMERAADLIVPLKVDIGIARNWDEAH